VAGRGGGWVSQDLLGSSRGDCIKKGGRGKRSGEKRRERLEMSGTAVDVRLWGAVIMIVETIFQYWLFVCCVGLKILHLNTQKF